METETREEGRAKLIARWPVLAEPARLEQYGHRCALACVDLRFKLRRNSDLHRSHLERLSNEGAPVMPLLLEGQPLRQLVVHWADIGAHERLALIGLERFKPDEPWVSPTRLLHVANQILAPRTGEYPTRRLMFFVGLLLPPHHWLFRPKVRDLIAEQVTDPLRFVGLLRHCERYRLAIRLSYLAPGELRDMLMSAWEQRHWREQQEGTSLRMSERTRRRWHIGDRRRPQEYRKEQIEDIIARTLRRRRNATIQDIKHVLNVRDIRLADRTIYRYRARLLKRIEEDELNAAIREFRNNQNDQSEKQETTTP